MSGATNNKDGSVKKWLHGRAVLNGELRFLSVSALEKGDVSKPNGCLRRWHYQYIGGLKEEQSDAMAAGTKLHAEIAEYLETGRKVLSAQVMAGLHMIPEPGSDLLIEHDMIPTMPDGKSGLKEAVLRASGIPIVGAIDLIHARGINKGGNDIEASYDPKGTIEVIDWKTCRTLANIKQGPELIKSIQMVGYGKYVFDAEPEAELVRLSHGYFPKQGSPRKTTIRVDRNQIEKSWEHANRVASSIRDAAKEKNPDLVEANTQACRAYGKDCPAIKVCSAAKVSATSKFVIIPTDNLTKNMNPEKNGILATIKAKQANSNLPAPRESRGVFGQVGAKVTTSETKAEATIEIDPNEEIEKLKAEMARLQKMEEAAKKSEADEMPEILPPDAPESDPSKASKPMTDNAFLNAMASVESEPEAEPEAPVEVVVEKKKRGRKPKAEKTTPSNVIDVDFKEVKSEPEVTPIVPERQEMAPEETYQSAGTTEVEPEPINLFVDCNVEGMETESLWPLIDRIHEELNRAAQEHDPNVRDFRMPKEMEFGKWKVVLQASIAITHIPGGNYTLTDSHTDIGQVVVEAMRSIVRNSGGVLVKGVR